MGLGSGRLLTVIVEKSNPVPFIFLGYRELIFQQRQGMGMTTVGAYMALASLPSG